MKKGLSGAIAVFLVFFSSLCFGEEHSSSFIKGMTVSCQTWGGEWATPEMAVTLDELKSLGVNAIAIHPYAQIQANGGLHFDTDTQPSYVVKPLQWAKDRKLGVMLVPHIAYWGSPFLWRGEINFKNAEEWNRFFADYEAWIVSMARIAQEHGAGTFCIGLEYAHAQKFDARWRRIIKSVRMVFHGKLTYGANWNEVEQVPFWDALDYIGVLAYFPLSNVQNPTSNQLVDGWRKWMDQLETISKKEGKPVIFTEIGYNESSRCAAQPWAFDTGGENAVQIQAQCIEEALTLNKRYPFLAGLFFWKWFPDISPPGRETFDFRTSVIKKLLIKHWGSE